MASRSVDVVAAGPPPRDPYEPSATAWALAAAFAARGDDVRVLRPEGPAGGPGPEGVASVEVPVAHRRPGAPVEQAAYAQAAGRRVRPAADLVVRDPLGLGPLRTEARPGSRPRIVAFVRSVELRSFDREREPIAHRGWVDRLDTWRDRRSVRRLEQAALAEADALFADDPSLAPLLTAEYAVPADRVRIALPPVPELPRPPSRDAARGTIDLPRDVPVIVAPVPGDTGEDPSLAPARETFRRIRPLFPGARLIVAGSPAPPDPGVSSIPRRDPTAFGLAFAAGNIALFVGPRPPFDPLLLGAMRSGCAVAAAPSVRLPVPPGDAVRYAASDDPGDLASTLAELVADPALVRETATSAASYAERYLPERAVRAIDAALPIPAR